MRCENKTFVSNLEAQMARTPAWTVYALCAGWNAPPERKRLSLRLECSETTKPVRRVRTLKRRILDKMYTVNLPQPITVHRKHASVTLSLLDRAAERALAICKTAAKSDTDMGWHLQKILDSALKQRFAGNSRFRIEPKLLLPGEMVYQHDAKKHVQKAIYDGIRRFGYDALATLPAPSNGLRETLNRLADNIPKRAPALHLVLAKAAKRVGVFDVSHIEGIVEHARSLANSADRREGLDAGLKAFAGRFLKLPAGGTPRFRQTDDGLRCELIHDLGSDVQLILTFPCANRSVAMKGKEAKGLFKAHRLHFDRGKCIMRLLLDQVGTDDDTEAK